MVEESERMVQLYQLPTV